MRRFPLYNGSAPAAISDMKRNFILGSQDSSVSRVMVDEKRMNFDSDGREVMRSA